MEKKYVLGQIISEISSNDSKAEIYAESLNGFKSSKEINSFKPDIEVFSGNTHNLIEVNLSDQFDIRKWKSFSEFSKEEETNEFHIVVPKQYKDSAKDAIVENGIDAQLLYF